MEQNELDEMFGITRCARCGQRLEGEVECPVCTGYYASPRMRAGRPRWIYVTACALTSPLSIPFIVRNHGLRPLEKLLVASGALIWAGLLLYAYI